MRWQFSLFLLAVFLCAEEVVVDLRNPTYKNGILFTDQGGVIKGDELRIQAKTLQYIRKTEDKGPIHRLNASGDLLVQYKGRAYVGNRLAYDFNTRSGTIFEGKTSSSLWFIGGDEIDLKADGSYRVKNAFVTTCENRESTWDLHATSVDVLKQDLFEAKKVRFRLFKVPLLWLPSIKLNLKKAREPFFRYQMNWDRGPLFGVRYQLYSWKEFALFGRVEYRWSVGWGGALETEFLPPTKRTTFVTRSYVGTDRLQTAPNRALRYRLEGALHSSSEDDKTRLALTWDKYSDVRMPGDFKTPDFEVNTAKRTLLYLQHEREAFLSFLRVRPRVNPFESIKQDLPTTYLSLLPRELGKTGILSLFQAKAAYLDFVYSDQLAQSLQDFHSARIEVKERLSRPIYLGPLTLTPHVAFIGIFYSNSPSDRTRSLALLDYGVDLNARAGRTFSRYKHLIEPYVRIFSLTHPTVSANDHYIFSIQDGYAHINQFQAGVRNLLFSKKRPGQPASFTADLYANGFTSDPTIPQFIPRLYLRLDWRLSTLNFTFHNSWNFRHQLLDFSDAHLQWTVNRNVALALGAHYRSRYYWRKADRENFILDVTRSESELLLSPLSDRRITLLTHLFFRFNPFWECHFQSHHGFFRINEKPYTEFKLDLFTWVSSLCKLRFTLTRVAKGNKLRPSFGLNLYK